MPACGGEIPANRMSFALSPVLVFYLMRVQSTISSGVGKD